MSLFMPTNVYPSKTGAVGNGTIDVSNDLTVSWQVNGSSAMTDFQIVIYENDSLSTQVFDTGKLSDGCPFYGVNSKGEVQFFSYTIPSASLTTAGMTNGNEYKLVITQWWSVSDSVTQSSASAFSTRTTPTVSIDAFADPLTERFATFTATYSQAEGDSIDWVRWQIANADALDELLYDSDKIYGTSELSVSYDGFFSGNSYSVKCIVQTENGIEADSGWETFDVSYSVTAMTSAITAKMYGKHNAVEVNFSGAKYIPAISGGTYSLSDGKLVLESGAYASWDTENTDPLEIGTPWTLLVKGSLSDISNVSSPFKAYMLDADGDTTGDNISLDVDSGLGTISVNASIGGESFNVLTANNAKNNSDFNLFVSPSVIALRVNSPTGGLEPSETLEPSNSLVPADATGEQLEIISKNSAEYGFSLSAIYTIEVLGESVFDYIVAHKENFGADSAIYSEVIVNDTYEPEYLDSTAFFATFENSLEAGNYTGGGTIVGYSIYRLKVGETILTHIIDVPKIKTTVIDYGASNQKEYQWYAFPITSSTFASTPLVSDPFRPCCWDWSILDCTLNEDGQYIVKKEYAFGKNLSSGTISNNNSPSIMQNFTQYPTVMQSSANYDSGSLTSLIGTIGRRSDGSYGYTDTLDLRQEIMNLSTTKDYLFLKSRKGDVNLIAISAPISVSITDNTIEQAQSVSIPWVKLDDAREYPIVQLPLESGEEDLVLFNVKALAGSTVVAFGNVKNTIARGDFTITNTHNTLFDQFNIYGTSEQEYFDGKNKLNYPMKAGNVTDGAIKEVTVSVSPKQDGTPWISSFVDTDPYTFRAMPSGADGANREYDKLVGGSVVWNQLIQNGDFASTSGWGSGGCTWSVSGNIATIVATGANPYLTKSVSVQTGHLYYVSAYAKQDEAGQMYISAQFGQSTDVSTVVGSWVHLEKIITSNTTANKLIVFDPHQKTSGDKLYLRDFMLIDLTVMFRTSVANSMTAELFRSYFPKAYYAYSLPTIQSVSVSEKVTTGINYLDGNWATGTIDRTTGVDGSAPNIKTASFIRVMPNTAYYLKGASAFRCYYDLNKNYVGTNAGGYYNGEFTTPSDCYYVRFVFNTHTTADVATTCLNISDPAINGTYYPYESNTYSLSNTELRGIPSLVDGKLVYDGDEYSSSGTVTRKYAYRQYTDDDVTLADNTSYTNVDYYKIPLTGKCEQVSGNVTVNGLPSKFNNILIHQNYGFVWDSADNVGAIISTISGNKDFWIGFTKGTTLAQAKTAINGMEIVAELATSATESTTPFTNPQVIDEHGTESYTDYPVSQGTRDVAIPVGHSSNFALQVPIEGTDEVEVYRSGKNILKFPFYNSSGRVNAGVTYTYGDDGIIHGQGTPTGSSVFNYTTAETAIRLKANVTYTFSIYGSFNNSYCHIRTYRVDQDGTTTELVSWRLYDSTPTFTYTPPADLLIVNTMRVPSGAGAVDFNVGLQIEIGSPATEYVPPRGKSYTHSMSTMYGGQVEFVSGVETTTMAEVDLSTLTWSYSSPTTSYPHGYFYAKVIGKETGLTNFLSNTYQVVSSIKDDVDKAIKGREDGDRVYAVDSSFDDATDFAASLSGVKLVYQLATPTTAQGVGEDIETLDGENVISTDADSLALRYGSGTTADSAALAIESQDALMVFNSTDMSANGVSVTIDDDGYVNASGTSTSEQTILLSGGEFTVEQATLEAVTLTNKQAGYTSTTPQFGLTVSSSGNTISITGTATGGGGIAPFNPAISFTSGHYYLLDTFGTFMTQFGSYGLPTQSQKVVWQANATGSGYGSTTIVNGRTYNYTGQVLILDLTDIFGVGNEPTTYDEAVSAIQSKCGAYESFSGSKAFYPVTFGYQGELSGASITLKNSASGATVATLTESEPSYSFTQQSETSYVVETELQNGDSVSMQNLTLQINNGTSLQDYEKYVGGYPLPSPDHPQPIKISDGTVTITGLDGVQTSQFDVRASGDGYKVGGFFLGETIPQEILDNPSADVQDAVIKDKNGDYWYCDVVGQMRNYRRIRTSNQFTLSISTTTQKNRWSTHATIPNTYVTTNVLYKAITSEVKSLSNRFKFNPTLESIQDGEFYAGSDCFAIRVDSCATINDFFAWTVTNNPEFAIAGVASMAYFDPPITPANPLSANARTIVTCDAESQPFFEVATYRSKYEGQLEGDTYVIQGGTGGAYLIEGDLNGTKTRERVVVEDGSTTDVDLTS